MLDGFLVSRDVSHAARIQPDRRWFGNTRTIGQKQMEEFRTAIETKVKSPFDVVLRTSKVGGCLCFLACLSVCLPALVWWWLGGCHFLPRLIGCDFLAFNVGVDPSHVVPTAAPAPMQLPMGLLTDAAKVKQAHLLDTEPFEETFSAKRRRKRPKIDALDFADLVGRAEEEQRNYTGALALDCFWRLVCPCERSTAWER